jgi:hypothetical protein
MASANVFATGGRIRTIVVTVRLPIVDSKEDNLNFIRT